MIYFIRSGKKGPIKIGYTDGDADQRLASLQPGNPFELNLLGCISGDMEREKLIHQKFEAYRVRGEWFRATSELLSLIFTGDGWPGKEKKVRQEATVKIKEESFELSKEMYRVEEEYIKAALEQTDNDKQKAAEVLGMPLKELSERMFRLRDFK